MAPVGDANKVQDVLALTQLLASPAQQDELLSLLITDEPAKAWQYVSVNVLQPEHDFQRIHLALFKTVYSIGKVSGPPPYWLPTARDIHLSNAALFMSTFHGSSTTWQTQRSGHPVKDWPLLQHLSYHEPEAVWPALLQRLGILFQTPPQRMLISHGNPDLCRWLPGARLNIAHCALHSPHHVPSAPAIVWADESQPALIHSVSMAELRARVDLVAAAIAARFSPGDSLAMVMPMTVDAVVIYLAVVLAGCAVVSIADSFSPAEIGVRLRIAQARGVFAQDVVLRGGKAHALYTRVVESGDTPIIVLPAHPTASSNTHSSSSHISSKLGNSSSSSSDPATSSGGSGSSCGSGSAPTGGRVGTDGLAVRLRSGDLSWSQFLQFGRTEGVHQPPPFPPHFADAYAATNIIFSSGTTGEPKAITWTHITPLRPAVDACFMQDVRPGHVMAWPTNFGWMMGAWILYATMLNGGTLALYQGAPTERGFGQFVQAARISMLGLIPSMVKAWRHSDCIKGLDWSCVRTFSSSGEASAPEDYLWLSSRAGYKPIIEYTGGTEIGGAFLACTRFLPAHLSCFNSPVLGARLLILSSKLESRQSLVTVAGTGGPPCAGELVIVPYMMGSSQSLLNKDHFSVYYEGMGTDAATGRRLRRHGDELARLPGGVYRALGRSDNTMNLGGIKVSSVELERAVVESVAGVAEVAAVAVPTSGGGPDQLYLFIVMKNVLAGSSAAGSSSATTAADSGSLEQLTKACQAAIRTKLNPLFKVERVVLRSSLPRNAAAKVMHRVLRDQELSRPSQSKL